MLVVGKVAKETIPIVRQLAQVTWNVTYRTILSPKQLQYMLDLFYSEVSLQKQMEDGHQFIMAFDDENPVGFASYSPKSKVEPTICRLHKIYVIPDQQGKGIGKTLLDFIIHDIRLMNATDLELNVNRFYNALHFYQKLGSTKIKEEDIDIGSGFFMNDYVLNLRLQREG